MSKLYFGKWLEVLKNKVLIGIASSPQVITMYRYYFGESTSGVYLSVRKTQRKNESHYDNDIRWEKYTQINRKFIIRIKLLKIN